MLSNADLKELLVCPLTGQPLVLMPLAEAESRMGGKLRARKELTNAKGRTSVPAGVSGEVLVREDAKVAYPVIDEIPVLLAPEALSIGGDRPSFDLTEPRYAEAYEEMEFYNSTAAEYKGKLNNGDAWTILPTEMAATDEERRSFPAPWHRWVDAPHDSAAQWEGYLHLGKMEGRRMLQLGGSGTHAVKFAMAGADIAWLVTPMLGEASLARSLADSAGVGNRFHAIVGIAEELPLRSASFDGIFAGGCLHHTLTDIALPEVARVLREGGKFSATEPWRAPFYSIGTKLLGQREHAYCKPLTDDRLGSLKTSFSQAEVIGHGTLTRYPLLAVEKIGIPINKLIPWHIGKIDDTICSLIPAVRKMGSSVAVLATK
jgi:uncharacterized protein YbaR (Trm112 family)